MQRQIIGTIPGARSAGFVLFLIAGLVLAMLAVSEVATGSPAAAQGEEEGDLPALRRGSTWHLHDQLGGGSAAHSFTYGRSGDTPLLCDWNGDGTRTAGVVRDRDGSLAWLLRHEFAGGAADENFVYGRVGDTPVCGDWNGNGMETVGVVRTADDGTPWFFLRNSNRGGGADISVRFGRAGDTPVVGDWNGDGMSTVGVARSVDRSLHFMLRDEHAGGAADYSYRYGISSDSPIVGDWNGDGSTTAGVVREDRWLLRDAHSGGPADHGFHYGRASDTFLVWYRAAPGSISGAVTEADSGFPIVGADDPIEGATVEIEETGQSTTTDQDGEYTLEPVVPGDYTVTADHDDYEPESRQVTVGDGEDKDDVDFALEPREPDEPENASLSGTVSDDETSDPVQDATVEIEDTDHSTTTDAQGAYSFDGVEPGDYTVTADADGYEADSRGVTLAEGEEREDFDFSLEPQPGSISGTVTEADSGFPIIGADDPIEGATVEIEETGQSTTTDQDGEYLLTDVPPGDYTVTADADGYQPDSQSATVAPGEETEGVDFSLEPAEEPQVELTEPTSEDPAVTPSGGDIDVTFETNQGGDYALDFRPSDADEQDEWVPFEGEEAAGTVGEGGEHAVTVTVPDDEQNADQFHDVRVVFSGQHPELDAAEDVEEQSLVVGDDIIVNVDQFTVHSELSDADAEAATGDTLRLYGTVTPTTVRTELGTDGLTLDGLGDGVVDFGGVGGPIYLDGDDQTLTGLEFRGFGVALISDDFRAAGIDPVISDNVFLGGGTAIDLEDSNGASVNENLFLDNEVGVATVDENATISDNEFQANDLGVSLRAENLDGTLAGNAFDAGHALFLCDESESHDLTSDGDLAGENDFTPHPPIAFDHCLRPELDAPYVHNLDSFEAHRGLQESIAAAGANDTLEAVGDFEEQVDIDVAGLTLRGEDAGLTNPGLASGQPILTVSADDVAVEGLTIHDDEGATTTIAVLLEGDGGTVAGVVLTRDTEDADQARHPLLRVDGEDAVLEDNVLTGGPLVVRGPEGDGVFAATLIGNTVSETGAAGISITVGDEPLSGLPLIGSGSSFVIEGNTVNDADLSDEGFQDLKLDLVPEELNGEEPEDGEDAANIIFDANAGIDSVEVPEGETHPRDRDA